MSAIVFIAIVLSGIVGGLVFEGCSRSTMTAGFAWGFAWIAAVLVFVLVPAAF